MQAEPVPDQAAIQKAFAKPGLTEKLDFARAREVAQARNVGLAAVPRTDGGYCLTVSVPGNTDVPVVCDPGSDSESRNIFVSWTLKRPDGASQWVVAGRITQVGVQEVNIGPVMAAVSSGGFFVAQVPEDAWDGLERAQVPLRASDASGETIHESCVRLSHSPNSSEYQETNGASFTAGDLREPAC